MDIGIVLPNTNPELAGELIPEWARRAEAAGFSTLAVADRVAYPSYDVLIALSAAAAVTSRIRLMTNVLLGPTRNPVLLAKETATLDRISRGRFILGIAVGGREDDFLAAGQPFAQRGRRWDDELEILHRAWAGEAVHGSPRSVAPRPTNGTSVPVLLGGRIGPAIRRMARWADGLTMGIAGPDQFPELLPKIRAAWTEGGRSGKPRIVGYAQYALGPEGEAGARRFISEYYGGQFRDRAEQMVQGLPRDQAALRQTLARFEEAGADELLFSPGHADLNQLERLADAVLR
jgi:alkanesulfonate monooxygenase SsuD/methylene tetrahydromethanopterin reductase-like flavin-dependent oxidoreductase (luciferase family)